MSEAGRKLIKSAQQALAYARGEESEGFVVHVPEAVDVKSIRKRMGLTQLEFSSRFGFDVRAVQDWEQNRRQPDRSARVLLTVIAHEPEAVSRALDAKVKSNNVDVRWVNRVELLRAVEEHYGPYAHSSIHGVSHWAKVEDNGLLIAPYSGADTIVVTLFAWFHDSCRVNDHVDHGHGNRAAEFAVTQRGALYQIDDNSLQLLLEALRDHTDGRVTEEATIGTCWDADRLDLTRVGDLLNPKFMSTEKGKELALKSRTL